VLGVVCVTNDCTRNDFRFLSSVFLRFVILITASARYDQSLNRMDRSISKNLMRSKVSNGILADSCIVVRIQAGHC
jgi:hypothetical protein